MYHKILVPLDGSNLSECTLSHVTSLVKEGSAGELTLLNVVKIDIPWAKSTVHFDINAIREPLIASAEKYLAGMKSRLSAEGIEVKTEALESNSPAFAITDYARKNGMNLIVMATHGYTGFKKMLLGSVASGVLNQSSIPVLLIRPDACCL
jgi:nucleotide-binding universal stress UspA family protein